MKPYFHVDHNGVLKEDQIINLVKYNDVQPSELQVHVDSLFPDGLTSHGEIYMLRGETSAMGINGNIELLFEYVRRSYFTSRPSRLQSFFAFEDINQTVNFIDKYIKTDSLIWEVKSEVVFKADMNLLTLQGSVLTVSYNAHRYWKGSPGGENPFWEYLMVPPVRVIRKIEVKK